MTDKYYPVYDVSEMDLSNYEAMGTKSKFWFVDENGDKKLFKATVASDSSGNDIQRPGEDWAEKIVCEIANYLSIPCAQYELALNDDQYGVISDNFVKSNQSMVHGNELIAHIMKAAGEKPVEKRNKGHKVSRVVAALHYIIQNKPLGWDSLPEIKSALDFFCGYVMLDALVSNQDRHDENWGMIISDESAHLAPSYDHAASLGRNESDEIRKIRMETKDLGQRIEKYVTKSRSQLLNAKGKRVKNLELFEIFRSINKPASDAWLERLKKLTPENIKEIIEKIPNNRMSRTSKEFTLKLICANRSNLLIIRENQSLYK
ncbi:hypothetical protein [Oceanospirillum maris]|uniref:hypothetical protein n=1 Tax=Oceanospirillum maris TaxID=64977 RepID=UPI0012FE9898|nr:hypothetical protein [Oceanospirillum maris]